MLIIHEPDLKEFAKLLSIDLKCSTLEIDIQEFSNGEFKIQQIQSDDHHAFLLFSNGKDINGQLLKFFLILSNLAEFEIIDVFIPYIPYSRQDKSLSFYAILNTLKSFKVRKIFTIDIHQAVPDPAIINILPYELIQNIYKKENLVVVAPDNGALTRAKTLANVLKADLIAIDKISGRITNGELAKGKKCLIVDDIVDSGKTLLNARNILYSLGAMEVIEWISDKARCDLEEFHQQIASIISREI